MFTKEVSRGRPKLVIRQPLPQQSVVSLTAGQSNLTKGCIVAAKPNRKYFSWNSSRRADSHFYMANDISIKPAVFSGLTVHGPCTLVWAVCMYVCMYVVAETWVSDRLPPFLYSVSAVSTVFVSDDSAVIFAPAATNSLIRWAVASKSSSADTLLNSSSWCVVKHSTP